MVRFVLLAVLVAACAAAAPAAQAAVVPVDVRSTASATVAQVPAAAGVATTVTSAVRPAVEQVRAQATTARDATAPATKPAVDGAGSLAGPTVERAGYTTEAAVPIATRAARELHTSVSATPDRAARFTRPGRGHTGSSAAHGGGRAALEHSSPSVAQPPADGRTDTRAEGAPRAYAQQRPAAPDPAPSSGGGNPASAPAAGLSLGGAALLMLAVCLAGPRLRRRLLTAPVVLRPVAFVSLLERPG